MWIVETRPELTKLPCLELHRVKLVRRASNRVTLGLIPSPNRSEFPYNVDS
jgi:hypothetical protein